MCFSNFWSVYWLKVGQPQYNEPWLYRSNLIILGPNILFLLILRIRLTYKFIIFDIKINRLIFLVFLKYRSNSHEFNKLVIKSKNACKYIYIYFLNFLYFKNWAENLIENQLNWNKLVIKKHVELKKNTKKKILCWFNLFSCLHAGWAYFSNEHIYINGYSFCYDT